MCGIVGAITKNNAVPIGAMTDRIAHHGPDLTAAPSCAVRAEMERVFLGMRRLAILDLSQAGPADGRRVTKTLDHLQR